MQGSVSVGTIMATLLLQSGNTPGILLASLARVLSVKQADNKNNRHRLLCRGGVIKYTGHQVISRSRVKVVRANYKPDA